ncbi:MAG TPA: hypothetical protein VH370_00205 [Humisphaera sp.]|nr:hypothetical protein [Humisphaera sp.]
MFVVLLLSAAHAQAADNPSYATTAQATKSGDKITVSIKLEYKEQAIVPTFGQQEVTTTLTNPKVMLLEGQQAMIAIGDVRTKSTEAHPETKQTEVESGFKIDVISIKGRDQILLVTTVIQHKEVVWADATTVKVVNAGDQAGNPK